jgi:hypothetical protein
MENGILVLKLKVEHSGKIIGSAIIIAAALDRYSEYLRNKRLAGAKQHL